MCWSNNLGFYYTVRSLNLGTNPVLGITMLHIRCFTGFFFGGVCVCVYPCLRARALTLVGGTPDQPTLSLHPKLTGSCPLFLSAPDRKHLQLILKPWYTYANTSHTHKRTKNNCTSKSAMWIDHGGGGSYEEGLYVKWSCFWAYRFWVYWQ